MAQRHSAGAIDHLTLGLGCASPRADWASLRVIVHRGAAQGHPGVTARSAPKIDGGSGLREDPTSTTDSHRLSISSAYLIDRAGQLDQFPRVLTQDRALCADALDHRRRFT
jgi:hypothetical protein